MLNINGQEWLGGGGGGWWCACVRAWRVHGEVRELVNDIRWCCVDSFLRLSANFEARPLIFAKFLSPGTGYIYGVYIRRGMRHGYRERREKERDVED